MASHITLLSIIVTIVMKPKMKPKMKPTNLIDRLPARFQWSIHNLVAHPLMEIFYQLGFKDIAQEIHDKTLPKEKD